MPTLQVDWSDPAAIGKKWMELDGREFSEQIGRREIPLPPILSVLDIRRSC
jgi:hypothetical protein